ncbi:MAG: 23S rRNA (pseudouridine(1915)-N(3))-methyltransferase RlmH [Waddliaceae bacterium]
MGYQIKILSVGRLKEQWLKQALDHYIRRMAPSAAIACVWAKNSAQLTSLALKEAALIGLDPQGQAMDSEQFSAFLFQELETHGSRLAFIIGDDKGLPKIIKKERPLVSLSFLTFPYQMTRLILLEQLYRAFEIAKNSRYHK